MSIVFVNRYFYPDHAATAQMLSDLAFHAASQGQAVTVLSSRQRLEDPRAQLPPREYLHGLSVLRVWTSRFGRAGLAGRAMDYLTFHLSALARLLWLLRPGDTVVAATDPPLLGVTAAVAARAKGARLVNWMHDVFPEAAEAVGVARRGGMSGRLLRRIRDASLRAAACNVVLGRVMAARVGQCAGGDVLVQVIHNWSDGDAIRPDGGRGADLRRKLGLEDRFVVAYSGNLGRAHDLSSLAPAAAALADLDDVTFLVTGGGAGLASLREQVTARGLRSFQFIPYQPRARLGESLALADVHLVSLRPDLEGLVVPSKLYGILAAGRPAVHLGDPAGEVAQILAAAQCGITVPPADGDALASALRQLHAQPGQRRAMGENARAVFLQRFDRPIAMAQWMKVLS